MTVARGKATTVVDAVAGRRDADAAALVFEYLAATWVEMGRAELAGVDDLPPEMRRECRDPAAAYPPPGTVLVAYRGGQPVGCVGLAAGAERTARVKRLYVRPAHRRKGVARALMDHAHRHAATHGIGTLVLDVLPSRARAIALYHDLGYADADAPAAGSPVPMLAMRRPVSAAPIRRR